MGVNVAALDAKGLFDRIIEFVADDKSHKVMYVNAHCMVVSQRDERYRKILGHAHLVYADGMSLVWGAKLSGHYLPGRLTAADFMPAFFNLFAEKGLRIFFLGARPGVAEAAAESLRQNNPKLKIVGAHDGYFQPQEHGKIIEKINRTNPHILMVGMGVPYQEKWIEEHFGRINARVIWGVGALFDFLSGRLPRGPQWLLDNGFEWLCRLLAEPRRLCQRYLVGNLLFMWYVFHWRFCQERDKREARGRN
ncbi:MAG: WecB/TagA/CpsF family glycosyltransferase [Desulfobacterales bacterium]|nr:WecB/TagA/CpsF family glycosyltransferase [Desulfobacterales bacterium]